MNVIITNLVKGLIGWTGSLLAIMFAYGFWAYSITGGQEMPDGPLKSLYAVLFVIVALVVACLMAGATIVYLYTWIRPNVEPRNVRKARERDQIARNAAARMPGA